MILKFMNTFMPCLSRSRASCRKFSSPRDNRVPRVRSILEHMRVPVIRNDFILTEAEWLDGLHNIGDIYWVIVVIFGWLTIKVLFSLRASQSYKTDFGPTIYTSRSMIGDIPQSWCRGRWERIRDVHIILRLRDTTPLAWDIQGGDILLLALNGTEGTREGILSTSTLGIVLEFGGTAQWILSIRDELKSG